MRIRKRKLIQKFFADRGTHLAAMIAYFALLSLVPLIFLTLSLLGFAGQQSESSRLVRVLGHVFPGSSVDSIIKAVDEIQSNATTLGIIGGLILIWTSLSLFSVLESAFNIVYGRPNRSFLHGKALALVLMIGSLFTLIVSLLVGSVGNALLMRYTGDALGNIYVAFSFSLLVSFGGLLLFLLTVYYVLTNVRLSFRDVMPGALTAAVILAISFQALPIYLRAVSEELVALKALGAPVILLVWLYVMANVIVFGAEVNWWVAQRRAAQLGAPLAPRPVAAGTRQAPPSPEKATEAGAGAAESLPARSEQR
jgi:membrane protein